MSDNTVIRGMFQGDIVIKTMIELGLEDMRKNPYLIEDVFSSLRDNPLLNKKYGEKEIQRAKEFILNNKIPVYMRHRVDKQEFPCITIAMGESDEDDSLSTLGDNTHMFEDLSASDINKPIPYIIAPFNAVSYDKTTGIVEIPTTESNYKYIESGMVIVDVGTGTGFTIIEKAGDQGIKIAVDSDFPSKKKVAIIPQYRLYRARREQATSKETYNIGCCVSGDPAYLIYLFQVIKYAIYRYREALLEHENFQLSRIKATDIVKDDSYGEDRVYKRFIILKGQVEETWIKAPKRFIENIEFKDESEEEAYLQVGIKVLGDEAPEQIQEDSDDDVWITIEED